MNSLLAPDCSLRPLATISFEETDCPRPAHTGNGNKARRRLSAIRAAVFGFALLESIHQEVAGLVPTSSFGFRF